MANRRPMTVLDAGASERARISKIMQSADAVGIENFAQFLALETDLTAEQALGALVACQNDIAKAPIAMTPSDESTYPKTPFEKMLKDAALG